MLLLDEPTNHLDLAKIAQLEDWLNALPRDMPVIISSHDRAFLDAVTNRTLFLRPEHRRSSRCPIRRRAPRSTRPTPPRSGASRTT